MDSLVSTEWLAAELGASDLRIVDATKHMPETGRDAAAEYRSGHIPGAVFMNLADWVDEGAPIENTMPSAQDFERRMERLGLGDGSRIVLYDDSAMKSATRAWFMLRMFGALEIAILDGGIAKWKAEGRPLTQGVEHLRERHFTAWSNNRKLRSKDQVRQNLETAAEQVVDARSAPRFTGAEPETRPGLASGHIPGSRNVHYAALFNADGTFKDREQLRAVFEAAGVDLSRRLVTSCGSGMTACTLAFALNLIGKQDVALYDGSWTEWGADAATPKAVGVE